MNKYRLLFVNIYLACVSRYSRSPYMSAIFATLKSRSPTFPSVGCRLDLQLHRKRERGRLSRPSPVTQPYRWAWFSCRVYVRTSSTPLLHTTVHPRQLRNIHTLATTGNEVSQITTRLNYVGGVCTYVCEGV